MIGAPGNLCRRPAELSVVGIHQFVERYSPGDEIVERPFRPVCHFRRPEKAILQ